MSPRRMLGTLLALVVGRRRASPSHPPSYPPPGGDRQPAGDHARPGTVFQGGFAELQPVNNDHDPDNDQLALCRLGTEHYRGLQALFVGNDVAVFARQKAKPGTYTFTYYACDFSYLTPGTITVTVEAVPKITVKKVARQARAPPGHQPGRLQGPVPLRLLQGGRAGRQPAHPQGLLGRDHRPPHPDRLDRLRPQGRALLRHRPRQRHQARPCRRPPTRAASPCRRGWPRHGAAPDCRWPARPPSCSWRRSWRFRRRRMRRARSRSANPMP